MVRSTSPHAVSESYIVAQNGSICLFVFRSYCICLLLASVAFGVCGFCGFCRSWILCGFWLLKEGRKLSWLLDSVAFCCLVCAARLCYLIYLILFDILPYILSIHRYIDLSTYRPYLSLSYLVLPYYLSIYLSICIYMFSYFTLLYLTLPDLT